MNSIVNTQPPAAEEFNPLDRPSGKPELNHRGEIFSLQPRPLLLIGREPIAKLPTRRAAVLFDALLAHSWTRLEDATAARQFGAYGQFLRVQIGEGQRSSNDRLDKAFDELLCCQWRFPVTLMSDAYVQDAILCDWMKEGRLFIWHFTPPVIALCRQVPLWIRYPISTARSLKTANECRLHELLRVFTNRNHPIWNVSVVELRRLMGVVAPVSDERFILKIIVPAVSKIEEGAGWSIKIERLPDPRIAPTERIRFTISRNGSAKLAKD